MSEIRKRNKEVAIEKPSVIDNKIENKTTIFFSRIVVISSLLIVVYFSSKDEKVITFASQTETLIGKGLVVECSQDYINEINKYDECYPKECKRFVTDQVVSAREVDNLLKIAKKGFQFGGSDGGASILDLHSGALSKGQHFINIYKIEATKYLFSENDYNILRVIKEKIKYAVAQHFGADPNKLYLTSPTFFSELTSRKPSNIHDEYWHPHVDKETYRSFHYTSLLYLGDYGVDFKGGRFVFIDEKFNRTIEPKKGRVSMFTSGRENFHYVEKVTSGVRYALTVAFTCDKQFEIN
ncbi:unnamed protein product [Diatraea saccharalis]|uniref:Prolyl 4-hydroxylase alpha subunit domain-containing protein n=1 Tax=Diatraea saccharalis TaxID=40085 RepID=A0A9N9R675_9NEOP|nr:unnamed protein product [Diatraea saccharalis]